MRATWLTQPLGELCEFQRGLTYAKGDEVQCSDNVVLRATNIDLATNLLDFSELKYISDGFVVHDSKKVSELSDGANINNLKFDDLKKFPVPHPSQIEQRRIVGVIDEAFAGIAAARVNAEKNLQNARDLFGSHLQSVFTQRGEGWLDTTIGDQIMLQRGFDITKDQQRPGDVPVVSSGGIKSFHDTAMVQPPGVVIGRKGTLGKVFYLENAFWPHDTTLWVKKFNGNDPRFVYYFFAGFDAVRLDSGTANPALNRNQVHPIRIAWPPGPLQKVIVEQLDAFIIETKRLESIYQRKLAALEELKRSLLHQAFTGEL